MGFVSGIAIRRSRAVRLRTLQTMRVVTLVALAAALTSCGGSSSTIASDQAAPIVNRLASSASPQRWDFTYQPDSASPYRDCLSGLDAVDGSVDTANGALRLAPHRDAPALIVIASSLLVSQNGQPGSWLDVPLDPSPDETVLVEMFGEILTSYIVTGADEPDLRATILAAIDIATSVETAPTPFGLDGEAIEIAIDPDLYLDELAAGGVIVTHDERDRIPTITAVIDSLGRVTGLVVDPGATGDDTTDAEHRDRYVVSASYDDLEPLAVPDATDRTFSGLDDLDYPSPDESCRFGS
jgi:hypothetical protein